ncbi:MAG: septum formation initiator family protein, partial [Cardiobacterium sp.]
MIKKSFVYLMLLAVAAVLLLVNLYLWHLERNTQHRIADLQQQVGLHLRENKQLNDRNDALRIDVENLRSPDSYYSYEEKAREDYGMIGKNETYFVLPDSE